MKKENRIVIFESKRIRKSWFNNEWYFFLIDIVYALTDSKNPTDYLKKMRKRDDELKNYIGTNCPQIQMQTESGIKNEYLFRNISVLIRKVSVSLWQIK